MASRYLQLFPVPNELPHIIRDLTKEILRYQPQDIIHFCTVYFKAKHQNQLFVWEELVPRAPRPIDFKKTVKKNLENFEKKSAIVPETEHKGTKDDHKGTKDDHKGTKDDHKSTKDEHKDPKDDHKGTKDEHKDPKDDHKGPDNQENIPEIHIKTIEQDMSSNTTQKENHSTAHIENPQKHEEKPNDTSIISLPDNQDQAAEVYISNLLDRVKNHISAST